MKEAVLQLPFPCCVPGGPTGSRRRDLSALTTRDSLLQVKYHLRTGVAPGRGHQQRRWSQCPRDRPWVTEMACDDDFLLADDDDHPELIAMRQVTFAHNVHAQTTKRPHNDQTDLSRLIYYGERRTSTETNSWRENHASPLREVGDSLTC